MKIYILILVIILSGCTNIRKNFNREIPNYDITNIKISEYEVYVKDDGLCKKEFRTKLYETNLYYWGVTYSGCQQSNYYYLNINDVLVSIKESISKGYITETQFIEANIGTKFYQETNEVVEENINALLELNPNLNEIETFDLIGTINGYYFYNTYDPSNTLCNQNMIVTLSDFNFVDSKACNQNINGLSITPIRIGVIFEIAELIMGNHINIEDFYKHIYTEVYSDTDEYIPYYEHQDITMYNGRSPIDNGYLIDKKIIDNNHYFVVQRKCSGIEDCTYEIKYYEFKVDELTYNIYEIDYNDALFICKINDHILVSNRSD